MGAVRRASGQCSTDSGASNRVVINRAPVTRVKGDRRGIGFAPLAVAGDDRQHEAGVCNAPGVLLAAGLLYPFTAAVSADDRGPGHECPNRCALYAHRSVACSWVNVSAARCAA